MIIFDKLFLRREPRIQPAPDVRSFLIEPQYAGNSEIYSGVSEYGSLPPKPKQQVWEKAFYVRGNEVEKNHVERVLNGIDSFHRYDILKYILSHTGSALCFVERDDGEKSIIKFPITHTAHQRCIRNFSALKRSDAFDGLKPRAIYSGNIGKISFFQEAHLPGRSASDKSFSQYETIQFMEQALALYELFSETVPFNMVNDDLYFKLIHPKIETIKSAVPVEIRNTIDSLNNKLFKYLIGQNLKLDLVHGDYKLENMSVTGSKITGLFDWDLSEMFFLFYDKVHLLITYLVYSKGFDFFRLLTRQIYHKKTPGLFYKAYEGLLEPEIVFLYWVNHVAMRHIHSDGMSSGNTRRMITNFVKRFYTILP